MKTDPAAILLLVILALLSTGVEIGDSFQPARILIIIGLFWVLTRRDGIRLRSRCQTLLLLFGSTWILWGLTSLLWTPDVANGIRELTGIALGLLTAFAMMRLIVHAPLALRAIRSGWVWAFAVTMPIAAWEVLYDQHLPGARGHDFTGGETIITITYAAATFGNRNTYSAFIVLAFPFLLWSLHKSSRWRKLLIAMLITAAVCIQLMNASRLGAGATLCELLAWLVLTKQGKARARVLLAGAALLGILAQVLTYLPYTQLRYNLFLEGRDDSVLGRTGLLECGAQFLAETAGAGVGAGGFAAGILAGRGAYDTRGAIDPHNVWVEVFSQYGLLVGVAFVAWLLYCAVALWRMRPRHGRRLVAPEITEAGLYGLVVMAGLPLNGMMNSGYITYTFLWAALGCVAGIVSVSEKARSLRCRRIVICKTMRPAVPAPPVGSRS
jgi:O-antigen ligase